MGGFWSTFGNNLAAAEAKKSPLASALYAASRYGKGKAPDDGGDPSQITQPVAPPHPVHLGDPQDNASAVNDRATALQPVSFQDTTPKEPDAHQGISFGGAQSPTVKIAPTATANPPGSYGNFPQSGGGGYDINNTGFQNNGSWWDPALGQQVGGDSTGGGTTWDGTINYDGGGSENVGPGGGGGTAGSNVDYVEDAYALGGVAPRDQTARIAESGPEMAGGRIISSPSIVKLEKGETVIPLTPRSGNKLQPDLLEGHVQAMKPKGEQFSRFPRYGQGRGLMR